jgi:hypothetical protein
MSSGGGASSNQKTFFGTRGYDPILKRQSSAIVAASNRSGGGGGSTDLTQVYQDITDLSNNLYDLSGNVSTLSNTVYDLSGNVRTLSNTVYDLSGNVRTLSNTVYDLSNNVFSNNISLLGVKTFNGNVVLNGNTFSNSLFDLSKVSEKISVASPGVNGNIALSYTTANAIIYATLPVTATANFSMSVSNLPVPSDVANTYCSYSLTLLLNVTNAKKIANVAVINGSSYTPISSGGTLSSYTVDAGASLVLQQFNIMYLGSSTPRVVTNILSLY